MAHSNSKPKLDTKPIAFSTAETRSRAACVVDLDNLLFPAANAENVRALVDYDYLDISGFANALASRRVSYRRHVYRHRPFSPGYKTCWVRHGFATIATGQNCDPFAINAMKQLAAAGCATLVLVAGDRDYAETVEALRAQGVLMEVWSRRDRIAKDLIVAADVVRFIDHLIHPPRKDARGDTRLIAWNSAPAASQRVTSGKEKPMPNRPPLRPTSGGNSPALSLPGDGGAPYRCAGGDCDAKQTLTSCGGGYAPVRSPEGDGNAPARACC
jgi:hypothetical protein